MDKNFKGRGKHLSIRQKRFLVAYQETLSIKEACIQANLRPDAVLASLRRPTLFSELFKKVQGNVINDARFTKAGSIGKLLHIQTMAEMAGDYKLVFDVQKEINKMIDGNLAIQKVLNQKEENVTLTLIDLTKKPESKQLEQNNIIEIGDAEEIE